MVKSKIKIHIINGRFMDDFNAFCCIATICGINRPGSFFFVDIKITAKAGVRKTASNIETKIAIASVEASARKNMPGTPVRKINGTKTTSVVNVAPRRGGMISLVACITASLRGKPFSRYRSIFSTTTMALSIRIPIAAAIPPRLIRFRFAPNSLMKIKVINRAMGMIATVTNVMRIRRRKRNKMTMVSNAPNNIASRTLAMDRRIKSVMSYHFFTRTFVGNTFCRSFHRFSTSCIMTTALVPCCLITVISTAGLRSLSQARNVSFYAGSMVAISDRKIGVASLCATIVFLISSIFRKRLSAMLR